MQAPPLPLHCNALLLVLQNLGIFGSATPQKTAENQ
jgi:hypothetical protein